MIETLMSNETVASILAVAGALWTLLTVIATITPSDKDNTWLDKVGKIADRFGIKLKGK
jgi:hypothetical protein